jgi:hypothetical protein
MGAIIVKIGDDRIVRENPKHTEEETRNYLLQILSSLIQEYKTKIPLDQLSVKYDPNYDWP